VPTFSPTIITNTTPAVTTVGGNITYDEIRRSLGDYVYYVKRVYMFSSNIKQINEVMSYQIYDVNGQQSIQSLTPTLDPYQRQSSLFYSLNDKDVILNGQSSLTFDLLPNVTLKIEFFTNRLAKKDALDLITPNNFKTLESAMGNYTFFEDWEPNL
jgi:hypothetical protein